MFRASLRRELLLIWRRPSEMINPLFFFVMVCSLFPLAVSPQKALLASIAPGIIWVAALLAVLLSAESFFRQDHENGALEQMLVAPNSLYLSALAKLMAHWLLTGLPLVAMAPVLAYMLHLPATGYQTLFVSLLLGTPVLSAVAAIGASLTVGLRNAGVLLALLVLPLYVPVLVFGAGVVIYAVDGLATDGVMALLAAMAIAAWTLAPAAVAAGLRISSGN